MVTIVTVPSGAGTAGRPARICRRTWRDVPAHAVQVDALLKCPFPALGLDQAPCADLPRRLEALPPLGEEVDLRVLLAESIPMPRWPAGEERAEEVVEAGGAAVLERGDVGEHVGDVLAPRECRDHRP